MYLLIGLSFSIDYLSISNKKIHSPIKTIKSSSSIGWTIRAMAWVINTKGFVFAIIGMSYAVKLFILCLLLFNLTLAP